MKTVSPEAVTYLLDRIGDPPGAREALEAAASADDWFERFQLICARYGWLLTPRGDRWSVVPMPPNIQAIAHEATAGARVYP